MTTPPIEVEASAGSLLGMPAAVFLRNYWQKRPLLIRQAFPGFKPPLAPEDLAGLACEEGALARLVRYDRRHDRWTLETGPFAEAVFPALPTQDWTLLVQDVDKWDADVRALLAHFDFLPRWRIDDVMVSFAAPGGSVGPHTDHYDVFLLQAHGRRRWQINIAPDAPGDFRDDSELKLLREFHPSHEFLLEPGDMLYLPPEIGHHGEAVEACMTFSIGMRAPSQGELLGDFADFLGERLPETRRYADPDLGVADDPALIGTDALRRARALLADALQQPDAVLNEWLGRFVTRYRSGGEVAAPPKPPSLAQLRQRLARGAHLVPHPFTRLAWSPDGDGRAWLFALGEAFACPPQTAQRLACGRPLGAAEFEAADPAMQTLALQLLAAGHLALAR